MSYNVPVVCRKRLLIIPFSAVTIKVIGAKFAIIKIKISPSLRAWNIKSYSMNTRREKTETQQNGLWPSALYNMNKNRWYWKKKLTHTIVSYTPPMTIASFHERLGFLRPLWNDEGSGHKVTSLCAFPKDIRYDQLGSTARNFGSYTVWTECSTANISPWHASHCPWSQSDGAARKTEVLPWTHNPAKFSQTALHWSVYCRSKYMVHVGSDLITSVAGQQQKQLLLTYQGINAHPYLPNSSNQPLCCWLKLQ